MELRPPNVVFVMIRYTAGESAVTVNEGICQGGKIDGDVEVVKVALLEVSVMPNLDIKVVDLTPLKMRTQPSQQQRYQPGQQ